MPAVLVPSAQSSIPLPSASPSGASVVPSSTHGDVSISRQSFGGDSFILNPNSAGGFESGSFVSNNLPFNPHSEAAFQAASVAAKREFPVCPPVNNQEALFVGGFCPAGSEPPSSSMTSENVGLASEAASEHGVDGKGLSGNATMEEEKNPSFERMGGKTTDPETPDSKAGKEHAPVSRHAERLDRAVYGGFRNRPQRAKSNQKEKDYEAVAHQLVL
jgi:hypothetical protein